MGKRKAREPASGEDPPADLGRQVKEEEEPVNDENKGGLVPFELERLKLIQRNRERLLALGLPSLVQKLRDIVEPEAKPKDKAAPRKKRVKVEKPAVKEEPTGEVEDEGEPGGQRRSRRIRDAASKPKKQEETAEQKFERQLGEFIVDGECPKCGRIYEKGHKQHLVSCGGPRAPARSAGYSALDKELLSDLTEEEKKDSKKRTLARMKALELSGLVDFTPEAAKFIVIGSKGDPYTITLEDEKHKCTCLDYRFRRHNCKHICLVLSQIGALDDPSQWHSGVESQLDRLLQGGGEQEGGPPMAEMPRDKNAEVALQFV